MSGGAAILEAYLRVTRQNSSKQSTADWTVFMATPGAGCQQRLCPMANVLPEDEPTSR